MQPKHILDGYRVLDLTQYVAGPTVTRLMAEMGAEIIKIEILPYGDPTRTSGFRRDKRSGYYIQHNRGKKSLCLNVKSDKGQKILKNWWWNVILYWRILLRVLLTALVWTGRQLGL